jgi:23S rRNA (uracil1939-C5)-methyltransferase
MFSKFFKIFVIFSVIFHLHAQEQTMKNTEWPFIVIRHASVANKYPAIFDKILDIEHCALQENLSNEIRLAIKEYALQNNLEFYDIRNHTGYLRNIVIRNTSVGEWMLVVIVAKNEPELLMPMMEFLHQRFPQITSLQYIVNEKLNDSYTDLDVVTYSGKDYVVENMPAYRGVGNPLEFKIGPKSFYQTNSAQAYKL